MVRISVLNDALRSISNAEKRGFRQVRVHPSSKVIVKFLEVMLRHGYYFFPNSSLFYLFQSTLELLKYLSNPISHLIGYIGEFEVVDDHRGGKIVVNLIGRINKTGVISPRFDIQLSDLEKWINNLLPSRQFGYLILTTSYGIIDHEEARQKKTGGKILGYVY